MTSRFMLIVAAISGFIYVALGAFGAHVLSKSLGVVEMGWIQTGLQYQAFHTLAIFGLAVAMQRRISIWFYWSSVFLALVPCCLAAACTALRCRICACGRISRLSAASVSWWAGCYC
ncbi:membrane protein [Salmonella bongori]|nr:membrane protein [Salmonella bongori]